MPTRKLSRRSFLWRASVALAGLVGVRVLGPRRLAAGEVRFDDDEPSEQVKKVLRQRFGARTLRKGHVDLTLPEDPPDGRVVPIFVESDLPMEPGNYVKALHLIVDKNPDIYLAGFQFTPGVGRASIDTRIKMRATSYVRAIAETSGGELWVAARKVYPGTNGCG